MKQSSSAEPRLRLWPAVVIVVLQWLIITVIPRLAPATMVHFFAIFGGPVLAALALAIWWLFASRLRWRDRGLVLLACVAMAAAALAVADSSIEIFALIIYGLPVITTAWALWLLLTPSMRWPPRRLGLLVVFLLAWGYFTLVRFEGVTGDMSGSLPFRWTETAEDKFMAEVGAGRLGTAAALEGGTAKPLALQQGDWPSFRGPKRDAKLTGVRIDTEWQKNPPKLVWRHRVGPGWSSFCVVGTRLLTQEQRGKDEVVVCYDTASGSELWAHRDSARFTEKVGGPGPRATPTFHDGKIYALGATGRLNCLDAATGKTFWSTDIAKDSGAKIPDWGFAASPLVAQGVVTVFAGGPDKKSVLGYRADTGKLAWSAGAGDLSYCSLQPARLGGSDQLLIATNAGLTAFHPGRGEVLWQHDWPMEKMARVVQPTILDDSDVLVGSGFGFGTRRVRITKESSGWEASEVWTTQHIKPYYNDLVAHRGHLYGFDGVSFTCVGIDNGKRKWRARGYGNGQVLLVADQDLLLILSETGEAALVEASPAGHKELGRFQALEGKTWNHPVLAHGKLFVRNSEEAACYQLSEIKGADKNAK